MQQPEAVSVNPETDKQPVLNYERKTNSSITFRENLEKELPEDRSRILVLPGGAMRGVYGAAALRSFEKAGFGPSTFDKIIGVSAGANNASYYLADQNDLSINSWVNHVPSREWIKGGWPVGSLDVDHLFDGILAEHAPLDIEAIRKSETELMVGVCEQKSGKPVFFSSRDKSIPFIDLLKASSSMPILCRDPVNLKGKPYMDGAGRVTIPLEKAQEYNPSHIVIIANNPIEFRRRTDIGHFVVLHLVAPFLGFPLEGRKSFHLGAVNYNRMKDFFETLDTYENEQLTIDAFFPHQEGVIDQLEIDKSKLKQAAKETIASFDNFLA